MPELHLWSGLRARAGGRDTVRVEGDTVGAILRDLVRNYPELEETIRAGVSVSVDGRIIASDLTTPVAEDSEIYLMQRLKGG